MVQMSESRIFVGIGEFILIGILESRFVMFVFERSNFESRRRLMVM